MCYSISFRNTFHPKYFNLNVVSPSHGIGHISHGLFVYLGAVDGQSGGGVEFLVTNVAFEVLGLLVKDEDFIIIKFTIAVPDQLSRE